MKLIRDRADVRWLPSRHRYALFRLLAFAMFRASGPKPRQGIVMAIDRDQSTVENYVMAGWLTLTSSCLAIDIVGRFLPGGASFVLGPLAALVGLQLLTTAAAVSGWPEGNNVELISFLILLSVTSASLYVAGSGGWARWVAWAFLASLLLNALASVVSALIRTRIAAAEREAGAA